MKPLFSFTIICCSVLLFCCEPKRQNGQLFVDKDANTRNIVIRQNDSITISIDLDSFLQLKSIVKFKNGVIDGEGFTFYPNGKLQKKIDTRNGIREGHSKYFYESGALKNEVFYCFGKPMYFGYEYWDAPVILTKSIIDFGENGRIEKIKRFDTAGHFLRDSFPQSHMEYSQD